MGIIMSKKPTPKSVTWKRIYTSMKMVVEQCKEHPSEYFRISQVGEKPKYLWGENAHHDVVRLAGDIEFESRPIIYTKIQGE